MTNMHIESTCDICGKKQKRYIKAFYFSYFSYLGRREIRFDVCNECIKDIDFRESPLSKLLEFFRFTKFTKK